MRRFTLGSLSLASLIAGPASRSPLFRRPPPWRWKKYDLRHPS